LLRSWDVPVEEYRLTISEVIEAQANGTLEEVFGAGTAAVISPVGHLSYQGKTYEIAGGQIGPLSLKLFDELMGIQYGTRPDPFNWVREVAPADMKQSPAQESAPTQLAMAKP